MAWRLVGAKPLYEPMFEYCSNLVNKLQWNRNRNSYISVQENAFEYVVCEMSALLSRPQYVKCVTDHGANEAHTHFCKYGNTSVMFGRHYGMNFWQYKCIRKWHIYFTVLADLNIFRLADDDITKVVDSRSPRPWYSGYRTLPFAWLVMKPVMACLQIQ